MSGFEVVGVVRYQEIEGGFYLIEAEDGTRYQPDSLPSELRHDGLRVRATLSLDTTMMSTRQAGTTVRIVTIESQETP